MTSLRTAPDYASHLAAILNRTDLTADEKCGALVMLAQELNPRREETRDVAVECEAAIDRLEDAGADWWRGFRSLSDTGRLADLRAA